LTGALPPVDFLPFLKYLPPLLAPWKTKCENTRRLQRKLYFGLLRDTEERVAQGHGNGSFMEQVNLYMLHNGETSLILLIYMMAFIGSGAPGGVWNES
jgi:hypothetical protein